MRAPTAKPHVRFYTTITAEADELRRRLQSRLSCSANELAERALQALDAEQRADAEPAK